MKIRGIYVIYKGNLFERMVNLPEKKYLDQLL